MKFLNKLIFTFIISSAFLQIQAQCNCETQIKNIAKFTEENFAGFQSPTIQNQLNVYKEFENYLLKKSIGASENRCDSLLTEYTNWFHNRHFQIAKKIASDNWLDLSSYYHYDELKLPQLEYKQLTDKTAYIRIGSFDYNQKTKIDSLIKHHQKEIENSTNLIIDVRGNGGGNDPSYAELMPIVATNQIRSLPIEKWASKGNIEVMENFYNKIKSDSTISNSDKNELLENINKMKSHPNEFVNIWGKDVFIKEFKKQENPKDVAILIDKGVGSTTEQFAIEARQSKKVKLLGTNSSGTLDYSVMHWKKFDCEKSEFTYYLGWASTKSKRAPLNSIDGTGVQPDIFIDNTINDWIKFTVDYLEK